MPTGYVHLFIYGMLDSLFMACSIPICSLARWGLLATSTRQLTSQKAKEVAVEIPKIGDVRRTKMR